MVWTVRLLPLVVLNVKGFGLLLEGLYWNGVAAPGILRPLE